MKFYPQAAYYAVTSGFRQKFNFITRTMPNISRLLQPTANIIHIYYYSHILLEGRTCSDEKVHLLSLPVKFGGIGIANITSISDIEYQISKKATKNLLDKIKKTEAVLTLKIAATK